MKNSNFRPQFALAALICLTLCASVANAGPVRMSDVTQIVASNPTRSGSAQLVVTRDGGDAPNDPPAGKVLTDGEQPTTGNQQVGTPQDGRVITEEDVEVVEEPCNCESGVLPFVETRGGGFPFFLLPFGGVPLLFCCGDDDPSPTPTSSIPNSSPSVTPSPLGTVIPTPSPSPSVSPSPSPSVSPSPSPSVSPSPSPSVSPSPSPSVSPSPSPSVSPSPSPSVSPSMTPKVTPSVTPPNTPSPPPTPSMSPSLPPMSPTPPPEVPEPATILLFGTGLSGIGFAARRWMRKRKQDETEENAQENKDSE